jgi:subtilisin
MQDNVEPGVPLQVSSSQGNKMLQNFTGSPRTRWITAITLLTMALALVAARPITARAGDSSDSDTPLAGAALLAETGGGKNVRVIVTLKVATSPEGELAGAADVDAQRGAIASAQDAVLSDLGTDGALLSDYTSIPAMAISVNEAGLERLLESGNVAGIVEDVPMAADLASSTDRIDAQEVWAAGYEGTGRQIAVLDTGVEASHGFFGGRVTHEACFSSNDLIYGSITLCPNGSTSQTGAGAASPVGCSGISGCDHGTHVAGIAAGNGASYDGVARNTDIVAIQVFSRFPSYCSGVACVLSFTSDQMHALDYIYTNRAGMFPNLDAINISIGGGKYTSSSACDSANPGYKLLIDNLKSVGVATVIAAGNDGYTDGISMPGCISSAVTIGATTDSDGVASFSNSASWLDFWAPGVGIDSSVTGNTFGSKSGTSMATPHVVGAFAVLRSVDSNTSVDDLLLALHATGVEISAPKVKTDRIDLDGAAAFVLNPPPNLISNGSFETDVESDDIPDGWVAKKWVIPAQDGITCSDATDGLCSIYMMGNGNGKKLTQTITTSGSAGDDFILSFDAAGSSVPAKGSYTVKIKMFLTNGKKATFNLKVTNTGTFDWTNYSVNFKAPKGYTRIDVFIQYSKKSGSVWLDDIVLMQY